MIRISGNEPYLIHTSCYVDDRGRLSKLFRSDWNNGEDDHGINEVYFTTTEPDAVKGFHLHSKQFDHISCIKGTIKVICADAFLQKPKEYITFYLSEYTSSTLVIPPGWWHGWKCVSENEAIIINCCSELHDSDNPDEQKTDPHKLFKTDVWKREDK